MHPKALVGLVRSRVQYIKDWPELYDQGVKDIANPEYERVFDISALLDDPDREIEIDLKTCGHNLPFPLMAVVGRAHGVVIIRGGETGFYCYGYTSAVPLVMVEFTETGWIPMGLVRDNGQAKTIGMDDPRMVSAIEGLGLIITLVTTACDNTRNVVSYTLTRNEKRSACRDGGLSDLHALDGVTVHHVCLDQRERRDVLSRRASTVVPTPKRLHEVRSHWRHLSSGIVVRVKAHHRGQVGSLQPRVYTAT